MSPRPQEQFQTMPVIPEAIKAAAEKAAHAEAELKNVTEEDVEQAFATLERKGAGGEEREHLKRSAEELGRFRQIQETVLRLRKTDMDESEAAVAGLRARIFGAPAELHQPASSRERIAVTGEALEDLRTLGRVAEAQRSGFGKETVTYGGGVEKPMEVRTPFASKTTFAGVKPEETPAEAPAMFSLADLAAREKKKAPPPPERPRAA